MSSKKQIGLKFGIFIGALVLLVLLDQWTKYLAVTYLMNQADIVLIPGVLQLRYLENRGIAFGLFQGFQWIFALITPLVVAAIFYVVFRLDLRKHTLPVYIICMMIVGGAIGNFIDRVFLGYVVDFIYFSLIDFPIFNVADILVTCASILMIFVLLFVYKEAELNAFVNQLIKRKEEKAD